MVEGGERMERGKSGGRNCNRILGGGACEREREREREVCLENQQLSPLLF